MNAAKCLKDAANIIIESPQAIQLRYLQTLQAISAERNSTVIFPLPINLLNKLSKWWCDDVMMIMCTCEVAGEWDTVILSVAYYGYSFKRKFVRPRWITLVLIMWTENFNYYLYPKFLRIVPQFKKKITLPCHSNLSTPSRGYVEYYQALSILGVRKVEGGV